MKADGGQLEAAAELYGESLRLRRELGDRLGTAVTLNSLGQLHWRRREPAAAAGCYRQSLELAYAIRSEEHASELQSRGHLVCRLLLEKKKVDSDARDVAASTA